MQPTISIGKALRTLRKSHGESLASLSSAIEVDRAYLNKIELDKITPSPKLLNKILVHYLVEGNDALRFKQLAGHIPYLVDVNEGRKEDAYMPEGNQMVQNAPQISINPMQTPVLFTDSTFVSSSDYGLILDIAQTVGGQQHNIVSRIGMSFDHAKKLVEVIQDHIEKNER